MSNDTTNGVLTGMALVAATRWSRYDDETQRRLRINREDVQQAHDLIDELLNRGEVVRARLPIVQDAQVGTAMASPAQITPSAVPAIPTLSRPDLFATAEVAISELSWPPRPGEYDALGNVIKTGELTQMTLSQTFEEVRAFIQGLVQSRSPSREAKVQIFYAANSLIAQIGGLRLTWQQYKDAWARLFGASGSGNATGSGTPGAELHMDPARPPLVVGALGTNVASVVPLSSQSITGYAYANRNTDAAMRFRVSASANNVNAGQQVCTIQFGTEYRYRDANGGLVPFQPVVCLGAGPNRFYADNITSTSFSLVNGSQLNANSYADVFISVCAGLRTES